MFPTAWDRVLTLSFGWTHGWGGGEPFWNRIPNAASIIPIQAKLDTVASFWEGDDWRDCPHPHNQSFLDIWNELPQVKLRGTGREDRILWKSTAGSTKSFSTREGWESCRSRGPIVPWDKAIWFSSNVPKHSFVTGRACLDGLPTAEQLNKRNINIPSSCRLCDNGVDSTYHLFFECEFSSFIWDNCMGTCIPRVGRTSTCAIEASKLATIKGNGNQISCIPKIMFNGIIYNIWQERNNRSFGGKKKTKEVLCRNITHQIEDKLSSMSFHRPSNLLESFICSKWNIDVH